MEGGQERLKKKKNTSGLTHDVLVVVVVFFLDNELKMKFCVVCLITFWGILFSLRVCLLLNGLDKRERTRPGANKKEKNFRGSLCCCADFFFLVQSNCCGDRLCDPLRVVLH